MQNDSIEVLVDRLIESSIARSRHHQQLSYNYSVSPEEDMGRTRVTQQLIDEVSNYCKKLRIQVDYCPVARIFRLTINLSTVVMNVKQAKALMDLNHDV